jgi:hypothetical protein
MKTLIIHPDDITTQFLSECYVDNLLIDSDYTLVDYDMRKNELEELIKNNDRIIMLGHGSENCLYGYDKYVIDSTYVYLLKDKICIGIWCNADQFFRKYHLKGFYTGMIISEYIEAYYYNINANSDEIKESNRLFALALKSSINTKDFVDNMKSIYKGDTDLIKFNQNNLFQNI